MVLNIGLSIVLSLVHSIKLNVIPAKPAEAGASRNPGCFMGAGLKPVRAGFPLPRE
jgi:hypothetical protein